ncbi:hypothetical protein KBI23_08910 [bacterium]|nr:hypothetical protein [bacterium]MBP9809235.1 hypothetical protein [bacterium]
MTGRSIAGEHKSNGKCLASLALLICSLLLAIVFTTLNAEVASAQFGGAVPPPVGDGPTPQPVNPGDTTGPSAVPTGAADPTPGTNNATAPGRDRTVIRLYDNGATGRGRRMVQTLRPDTLSAEAQSRIGGILGINMNSGEQSIDVTVTRDQIAQIQDVIAAYPQTTQVDGRNMITGDDPAAGYPRPGNGSLYRFDGQLPTVATFSRYLVILGVVVSTVFMAIAAYSVVMGSRDGGNRVIGAASGLLFLMAAYTIWKIVTMNTFHGNSPDTARAQNRPTQGLVQDAFMTRPNLPATPGGGVNSGAPRGGVPVQPLGTAGN